MQCEAFQGEPSSNNTALRVNIRVILIDLLKRDSNLWDSNGCHTLAQTPDFKLECLQRNPLSNFILAFACTF